MERATPILPGTDLAQAREWYVGRLGFAVRFEHTEDGRLGLLGFVRGGLYLTIDAPMDGHGRDACVALEVEDAARYHAEWAGRGAKPTALKDEAWGACTFELHDPFGNTLFVIGPPRPPR